MKIKFTLIKNMLLFEEKQNKHTFIMVNDIGETDKEISIKNEQLSFDEEKSKKSKNKEELDSNKAALKNSENSENIVDDPCAEKAEQETKKTQKGIISTNVEENLAYIKKRFSAQINGDFKLREFNVTLNQRVLRAFIFFFDGLSDSSMINLSVLQPLMTLSTINSNLQTYTKDKSGIQNDNRESNYSNKEVSQINDKGIIMDHFLPQNQAKMSRYYIDIIDEVNFGGCGVFIDTLDEAFAIDVKGWEHRGVGRPENENVIRGPQEAFNEVARVNSALLRKIMKDEDLIAEDILVGKRSKTPCTMFYIKDIANNRLVSEVRNRLNAVNMDYLIDSGELEQLIEDNTFIPTPQMLATERPDRISRFLSEGRVAICVHGSPNLLALPVTFFDMMHSAEDSYLRFPLATILRYLRLFGVLLTLLLPAIFISITNYHQEMVPTELLLAIAASNENVPFPTIFSLLIMELSFELIREAGVRIPGAIGQTIGIIGGLILGQAAVAANLVSPILIIIVALTGIGSFGIPDFSLGNTIRFLRFVFIFFASILGFLGIAFAVFILLLLLSSAKSFGVPFFTPYAPHYSNPNIDSINRAPMWAQEQRPEFVKPKDKKRLSTLNKHIKN